MVLTLSCELLVFARANVVMLRRDNPEAFCAEAECGDNVISSLNLVEPAVYDIWLSDIEAKILSTGKNIRLNGCVLPWPVEFTQEDVDHGKKTFALPSDGVFRATVVDERCKPIPHHKLTAFASEKPLELTLQLQMDENGTMTTYGNPTRCLLLPEPGIGVLIHHLDLNSV